MTDLAEDDPRIDELFTLTPDEFTAARNTLVKQLRHEGHRDLANAVGALRRPTAAAWAVNQTVRRHGDRFARLLDAGDAVRNAQRRALPGVRRGGMREATRTRRDLIEELAGHAVALLDDDGASGARNRGDIVATFNTASADAGTAAVVGAGRLSRALPVSSDFGALEDARRRADDAQASAERIAAAATQDPDQEQEWLQQSNVICGALAATGVLMVQPFLTAAALDLPARICVVAFAVAIPLLAALVMVNRQEVFRHRRTASVLVTITQWIAQACAFVGIVAGFWHIWWVAGLGMLVGGLVGVGVHSAGYWRLELDLQSTTPAAEETSDGDDPEPPGHATR